MIFRRKIREIREMRGMLQRPLDLWSLARQELAAALEIDTPMYSKIERGERKAKRNQIPIMARLFEVDERELLTIWLADKVLDTVEGEDDVKQDAIEYAQKVTEIRAQCKINEHFFAFLFCIVFILQ